MAAWTLTDQEFDEVDEFRSSARDARVFRNATIILMSSVGRSKSQIAETLGCRTATVDNVRATYRYRGIAGLTPSRRTRNSRHRKNATEALCRSSRLNA